MHHIAVCDDEEIWVKSTTKQLDDYFTMHNEIPVKIHSFQNGLELLEKANGIDFDLYIIDVLMPAIKGIDLGRKLRDNSKDGMIIYLTSSKDFALEAYDVQPFHYLIKPLEKDKLFSTLDRAFDIIKNRKNSSIVVKTKDGILSLAFDDIIYVEYANRICKYHLRDGQTVSLSRQRQSFAEISSPLLEDDRFSRCGASLVVNLYYVNAINKDQLYFKDNPEPLFLPKKSGTPLLSAWLDYWMKGEKHQ